MDVLAEINGKVYARATIDRPGAFMSPFFGVLFPCPSECSTGEMDIRNTFGYCIPASHIAIPEHARGYPAFAIRGNPTK